MPAYVDAEQWVFDLVKGEKKRVDSNLIPFVCEAVLQNYQKEFSLVQSYFEHHMLLSKVQFEGLLDATVHSAQHYLFNG